MVSNFIFVFFVFCLSLRIFIRVGKWRLRFLSFRHAAPICPSALVMSRRFGNPDGTKVYVGDLGIHGDKYELERKFERFGRLREVWVAKNPPGFAFIMFEDHRDAEDAVRALHGTRLCGQVARVEISHGRPKARR